MKTSTLAIAALLAVGCLNGNYVYRPAEQATATVRGQPAARYPIPPESPRGDVRVASFGVTKMELAPDHEAKMLQVRMVVSNDSDQAWQIDTRKLAAHFPVGGTIAPAYVNTDGEGLPLVPVEAKGQRALDVYFTLPEGLRGARDVPEFDLAWEVRMHDRVVAQRTPFERLAIDASPYYYDSYAGVGLWGSPYWGRPLGWGSAWWYDPIYAPYRIGPRAPVIVAPPRPLHMGRPPAHDHRR